MKGNIKIIIGILIGLSIAGIVVYADTLLNANEIDYTPSNSNFNVSKVDQALNTLYNMANNADVSIKKICELKSGTAEAIGSKYECNPGDNVKRNFYVLTVRNNEVDLIMEHNITEGSNKTSYTWAEAMDYFNAGDGVSIKNTWTNIMKIDLPSTQDIANAVGNTSWKVGEKNYTDWFYFDKNGDNYGQTQVANSTTKSNYTWLFNYTRNCAIYGCNYSFDGTANSNGKIEEYGYWTRDIVARNSDTYYPHRAWGVDGRGVLHDGTLDSGSGIRPVITVLKSNLY